MRFTLGRRGIGLAAGAVVASVVVSTAVAGSAQNPTYNLKTLRGSVTADGSSTVGPFTTSAAELFRRAGATSVRVTVGISGTGGGFERFCKGETDISNASRPMRNREAVVCKANGVGWRGFHMVNDALTVVINPQNTWASCLTVDELKKIWDQGSKVNSWKDVRPGFPDVPLKLFGAGTDSGTFDYFTLAINGQERRSRTDYSASEDDNVTVQGVSGERGGMGYFGFSYFEENRSRLKALQIRNPKTNQCVTPSISAVHNNAYKPLSRPLFIYAKGPSFKRSEVQAFLDYTLDNQAAIARRAEFVPLTPKQVKRARTILNQAIKVAKRS